MKEMVVISGKGGTGKTSLTAALAVLARPLVLADGDVDASDLHLLLHPRIRRREMFRSGRQAVIRAERCTGCGLCREACRFDAIRASKDGRTFRVEPAGCEGCGVCVRQCPQQAIDFPERDGGEWFVSDTHCGPMVHARLTPGGENSGKLVTRVREEARTEARARGLDCILLDGPPGIGCPVMAALTGATLALIVTEPTPSGEHDMERVHELTRHFNIPTALCVNKWDINPAQTERIERRANARGARIAGRIGYSRAMTEALFRGRTVIEGPPSPVADEIRVIASVLIEMIGERRIAHRLGTESIPRRHGP